MSSVYDTEPLTGVKPVNFVNYKINVKPLDPITHLAVEILCTKSRDDSEGVLVSYEGVKTLIFPIDCPYEEIGETLKAAKFIGCKCIYIFNPSDGMKEEWVSYGDSARVVCFEDIYDEVDLIKVNNSTRHK